MNNGSDSSIRGSKSALYAEPGQITFQNNSKSGLVKCLLFLTIAFAIVAAVFMGLFVYYFAKYESANEMMPGSADHDSVVGMTTTTKATTMKAETTTMRPETTTKRAETTTESPHELPVCNSKDCVIAAAAMAKRMDLSADPCEDFATYSCGGFVRDTVYEEGRTRMTTFSEISDENNRVMRSIIDGEPMATDPRYLTNMRDLYTSCFDEEQIEVVGLAPYLSQSEFVNDWPTLNPSWDESTFDLAALITKYEKEYIEPLFVYYVSTDMMDSNSKALYISDPSLGLSQDYFRRPRNDSVILAYEKYLIDSAIALGANPARAAEDASAVVDLEKAITEIMTPREERRDSSKQYNPTTLNQLGTMHPTLDIPGAVKAAFETANVTVADNERVINSFPNYIGNLTELLAGADRRAIQNLFGFKYALTSVSSLTAEMRKIQLEFDKVYRGKTEESPRWETCLSYVASTFWKGMSKEFVKRTFSNEAKDYMNEMIVNLKAAFTSMVEELTWMSEETKQKAYYKVEKITQKIGYPDEKFDVPDIEKYYENYTMVPTNYYQNRYEINKLGNIRGLKSLREPVDKAEWLMAPHVVNAYYSRSQNDIVFPAGILQPPFFSQSFKDAANYGGIGVVIGHEITHGFDDQGSQYDGDGNLNNWWEDEDRAHFLNRTQCIVNQYSGFKVPGMNLTVNGINTQGEAVADNGGVKESYRAYRSLVAEHPEVSVLPGLHLTPDQVFFLSYGQVWCEKMTQARWVERVLNGVHPPGMFRTIGALQNSKDFAEAFNCAAGTYMNPTKKCEVW